MKGEHENPILANHSAPGDKNNGSALSIIREGLECLIRRAPTRADKPARAAINGVERNFRFAASTPNVTELRMWEIELILQSNKTGVRPKVIKLRFDLQKHQPVGTISKCFLKPVDRSFVVAQSRINDRKVVGREVLVFRRHVHLRQNLLRFGFVARARIGIGQR